MNFVLMTRNFAFKMMNFVLKLMNFAASCSTKAAGPTYCRSWSRAERVTQRGLGTREGGRLRVRFPIKTTLFP